MDRLLYVRTLDERLQCSDSLVYDLMQQGKLDACRIGSRAIPVSDASVQRYLDRNRIDPGK